ncbi:ferrochelatase [Candidatus Rickettsiella viridis]|uniref:Ferrochelatase n=1 Tax=Candidatus Rickettsiella viridis TaxID=676208 RepID=A0A2Z5UVF4_9COXI|nr:ferrochelatase [Candidatus Rickettsiella viridis]BBB15478.1 ferrochelatase [Candidatus Rickettsiella viridis]
MTAINHKAILLLNLGTPSAPAYKAVRQYLTEFLSDPRVVELPAWLWQPFLRTILLPLRSKRTARLYQSIWMEEGSPLAVHSKRLAEKVQQSLGDSFKVVLAMRYGQPSVAMILKKLLQKNNIQSLIILPLYPQYSATTTASCFDEIARILKQQRFIPSLQFISSYFDHPLYIAALAASIRQYWMKHGNDSMVLFSFHGLPQRSVDLGDPYAQQCHGTVNLLVKQLNLSSKQYRTVFQSRFGKAQWLQPYCDVVLQQLPRQGVKRVLMVCPGFAVDCLETLEEISQRYQQLFLKAGGESFHYIPALNATTLHSELLVDIIHENVKEKACPVP